MDKPSGAYAIDKILSMRKTSFSTDSNEVKSTE